MSKIVKMDFKEYQKHFKKGISKDVLNDIEDFSIKFMRDNFDIDFNIPIVIDGRMERRLGTFFIVIILLIKQENLLKLN